MTDNDTLTMHEAYAAMYRYLERYHELTKADEIGAMLGSMSFLPDGGTADSTAWSDWLHAVEDVRAGLLDTSLSLQPLDRR